MTWVQAQFADTSDGPRCNHCSRVVRKNAVGMNSHIARHVRERARRTLLTYLQRIHPLGIAFVSSVPLEVRNVCDEWTLRGLVRSGHVAMSTTRGGLPSGVFYLTEKGLRDRGKAEEGR